MIAGQAGVNSHLPFILASLTYFLVDMHATGGRASIAVPARHRRQGGPGATC